MARTWTLEATISPGSVGPGVIMNRALVLGGEVYFVAREHLCKWNGTTDTVITDGSSFPNSALHSVAPTVYDFCVFDGELFAGIGYATADEEDYIYRHTGGITWVLDTTLEDEDGSFPYPHFNNTMPTNTEGLAFMMDCDTTYMFIVARQAVTAGATVGRMISRTTGGIYAAATMPGGGYDSPQPQLVGLSKGSRYGSVVGVQRVGANTYRAIQRGGPNFSDISGADIGDKRLIGYADGHSFWSVVDGSNWELKRSTDWGVNLLAAGNVENPGTGSRSGFVFKDCGDGAIMLAVSDGNEEVYTWDTNTNTFIADGSITAGRTIFDFFVLNNTLYLVAEGASSSSVDIWNGGSLSGLEFFYGIDSLTFKSTVPLGAANQETMAVRSDGVVAIGNANPNEEVRVVQGSGADDWATWEDISHDHGEAAVAALRWVNG